jgi:methyl-accepting chemotaxis protein
MPHEHEMQAHEQLPRRAYQRWKGRTGGAFVLSVVLLLIYEQIAIMFPTWELFALFVVSLGGAAWTAWWIVHDVNRMELLLAQSIEERDEHWRVLLDEYSAGLPVLNQQLEETARQVEQSVVDICAAFSGMVARAQSGIQQNQSMLEGRAEDGQTQTGVRELIETARNTLTSTLDRIIQSSTYSMRLVYRMEDIEEGILEISNALREIEQIASRTKLLALNTTIEAARFHGQSKGFAVVAAEITRLAERTTSASETIRGLVRKVKDDVHRACEELRDLASTDMNDTVLSQEQIEKTLSVLDAKNKDMRRSVELSIRNSQELANDISQAVIGLQFQDAVNQRIGHVVTALQEMQAVLDSALTDDPSAIVEQEQEQEQSWTERMQQQHTMASERQVVSTQLGTNATVHTDNNVELF